MIEDECISKLFNLIKRREGEKHNLANEIESQKEICESKKRQLTQLVYEYNVLREKLNDLDERIELEEFKNSNSSSLCETQNYIECLLKENKEKYDIYLEQIDYYKELHQFDIKLAKVTYEENIEELIENCKYDLMDAHIKKFNQTAPKTTETVKELILSLNSIF